jgi:hypothetical protein
MERGGAAPLLLLIARQPTTLVNLPPLETALAYKAVRSGRSLSSTKQHELPGNVPKSVRLN